MNKTKCDIYDKRPNICKDFPHHAGEITEFSLCTFTFKDGVRKGTCSGCGECCIDMPWDNADPSVIDQRLIYYYKNGVVDKTGVVDPVCRYLTK